MGRVISAEHNPNDITIGISIDDFIIQGLPALLDTAFIIGSAMQYVKDSFDIYEKENGVILQIKSFDFIERSFKETIDGKDKPDIPIIVDDVIHIFEITKAAYPQLNRIELMMYMDTNNYLSKYICEYCHKVPVLVKKDKF